MVRGITPGPIPPQGPEHNEAVTTAAATVFINETKTTFNRKRIRDIAKGFAELAYSLGETNDEDEFTKEMEDDIFEAFKRVEEKQQQKKKR